MTSWTNGRHCISSVFLLSGGKVIIDEAAAVTAIDVDSGGGFSSRRGEDFSLATNLEAATEIGRQIQLRELAGQIIIDFLPLKRKENQKQREESFEPVL